jgi:cyclic pyranopterin phosphate synthase
MVELLKDTYDRTIRDLRVSLTDRCNFRCFYCRPISENFHVSKETVLTFEEIFKVCEIFVSLGIEKIRLTGGEPLLRKDAEKLITELSKLKPSLKDIALTTNGFSLPDKARDLKTAGLDRVTISLDSLEREKFKQITGIDRLDSVLGAIESAKNADLKPIKINTVVIRNTNDNEVVDFAKFARENNVSVRFIEFMPLDSGNNWQRNLLVPGKEIIERIENVYPLELKKESRGKETAWKFGFADGACGEIGIIAPVTNMFCGACSRIRLTADGQIRTCLFSHKDHNLRDVVRSGASRIEIVEFIKQVVLQKEKRHHINDADFVQPDRTMSMIGG